MIIAIDTETYEYDKENKEYNAVLNSRKFLRGVITYENMKSEIYKTPEEMWEKILELGRKCASRGAVLNVYGHYHEYDFYGYANLKDKNIKYFCFSPFILAYMINNKEKIKFLDSLAIYKFSLKTVGEVIGLEKGQLPMKIKEDELEGMEKYMTRDSEIVMKAILDLKQKLKEEGINLKRLYTINQIAIAYLLKKGSEDDEIIAVVPQKGRVIEKTRTFYDKERKMIWRTNYAEEIHAAYRGGRVQAFKTGTLPNVTSIDINSLYPHSFHEMRYPDLTTERKIEEPLEQVGIEILNYIGLSRCIIQNKEDELGILPIRTKTNSYTPTKGKTLIGTWTHEEIKTAINNGYKLLDIEWSIIWQDTQNPFKKTLRTLYKLKRDSTNQLDRYFYKGILNRSIGKFAQQTNGMEIVMDSIEKAEEYVKQNYQLLKGIDYDMLYKKTDTNTSNKHYYCPIIPTLVNAASRIKLYKELQKIPKEDLIYCDTDSIKFQGDHISKYDIGKEMGQFKTEHENDLMICYGSKTYMIGEEIKVSGFRKKDITKKDFTIGMIQTQKMVTIKTATEESEIGTQRKEYRDLVKQEEDYWKARDIFNSQSIMIDNDVKDIKYFSKKISKLKIIS